MSKYTENQSNKSELDEINEVNLFDSSKNIFDSEQILKNVISGGSYGYKEYDFEPDGSIQQQETEQKIQNLWRTLEKTGIEPYRVPKKKKASMTNKTESSSSTSPKLYSPNVKPSSWTEALEELTKRGMDKEAECAKHRICKICENSDLGQVYADEAYEDRYIKPCKPYQCN